MGGLIARDGIFCRIGWTQYVGNGARLEAQSTSSLQDLNGRNFGCDYDCQLYLYITFSLIEGDLILFILIYSQLK